jgi:glycogen debranching enzyme
VARSWPTQSGPRAAPESRWFHAPREFPDFDSVSPDNGRDLKHGDSFAFFDSFGDASPDVGTTQGIYYLDTRHLSRLSMILDGARPMLLSSTLRDDNATLTCDLSNPDRLDASGELLVQHDVIHLRRSRFLWNAGCYRSVDEVANERIVEDIALTSS